MAGEDEGKSVRFQCAVHLPVDKWHWHKSFLNLHIRGVLMMHNQTAVLLHGTDSYSKDGFSSDKYQTRHWKALLPLTW